MANHCRELVLAMLSGFIYSLDDGSYWLCILGDNPEDVEIHYCPFCGRELDKERT